MTYISDAFEANADLIQQESSERKNRLSSVQIVDGKALMNKQYDDPTYIWEGILPDAGLCLVAANKAAGKTLLLLQAASAISKGRDFLGIRSRPTKTLFLELELSERKIKERLLKMGTVPDRNFSFIFKGIGQGELSMQTAIDAAIEHNYKLIIVDVMQNLWPADADINSYQDAYSVLAPLREFAYQQGCLIVLVTHMSKKEVEDYIHGVMGSTGIVANADVILSLRRERGADEAVLYADGNDIEHREIALSFNADPLGFTLNKSAPEEIGLTNERREVLEAIRELGGVANPSKIAMKLGKDEKAISKLCISLAEKGLLSKLRYGTYSLIRTLKGGEVSEVSEVADLTSPTSTTSLGFFEYREAI